MSILLFPVKQNQEQSSYICMHKDILIVTIFLVEKSINKYSLKRTSVKWNLGAIKIMNESCMWEYRKTTMLKLTNFQNCTSKIRSVRSIYASMEIHKINDNNSERRYKNTKKLYSSEVWEWSHRKKDTIFHFYPLHIAQFLKTISMHHFITLQLLKSLKNLIVPTVLYETLTV